MIYILFQTSQELVAEVSGLEKQRDQLEAELKKVFDYLSSLNCLICKAKDENFMVNGVFWTVAMGYWCGN